MGTQDNRLAQIAKARFASLPKDMDGPDRAMAFRAFVLEAQSSPEARDLVCTLYSLLANGEVRVTSLYDVHMFVASVTECLDIVPLVSDDIDRFLARYLADQGQVCGLWTYVRELYQFRAARKQAKEHGERVAVAVTDAGGVDVNV